MRRSVIHVALTCALACGVALTAAPGAMAGLAPPVVDCNAHSKLTRHYSPAQLENALNTMPSDIAEYSDCVAVIQKQLLAELGTAKVSRTGDAGSGGSFLPTPVIVAIAVLALIAAGLGVLALRRRRPPVS